MALTEKELKVILKLVDQLSKPMETAGKSIDSVKKKSHILDGVMAGVGMQLTGMAAQLPRMAMEFVKLGSQAEAAKARFEGFAGGADLAAGYLDAFMKGADGAVSQMDAMAGGAKLLGMGLVTSAGEMESVAAMALKLGDQTMGAGQRISDFAMMLANQSIPRLDNFNISSGKVRQRIDELLKSGQALNREQAFKMAVMEQGSLALGKLGDTSELAITKMDRLDATVTDLKVRLAESLAPAAGEAADALSGLIARADELEATQQEQIRTAVLTTETYQDYKRGVFEAYGVVGGAAGEAARHIDLLSETEWKAAQKAKVLTEAMQDGAIYMDGWARVAVDADTATRDLSYDLREVWAGAAKTGDEFNALLDPAGDLAYQSGELNAILEEQAKQFEKTQQEMDESAAASGRLKSAVFDMSMSWTTFFGRNEEQAIGWAEKRETAETQHLDKMAEIQKSGQARQRWIDAEAEKERLGDLRYQLGHALQQQSEFTDKTRESVRMAKEHQIQDLQGQITEQEKLLEDHYAGRLIIQGKNIAGELSEEERRYQEQLKVMEREQAKQEEAQRQSLGRMLLQQFESWVQMKGIPADQAFEMRLAIAEEYGLIDKEAAESALRQTEIWDAWARDFGISTETAIGYMDNIIGKTGAMKRSLAELPAGTELIGGGGVMEMQHGSSFFGGGMALLGETGPEMAMLPRGTRVLNSQTTANIGSNNVYNIHGGEAAAALMERERQERLASLARFM